MRRLSTARPALVEFRLRNPCARFRLIFDGWYVGFLFAAGWLLHLKKCCVRRRPVAQGSRRRNDRERSTLSPVECSPDPCGKAVESVENGAGSRGPTVWKSPVENPPA